MANDDARLEKIETKIDALSDAVSRMASQAEQIAALWRKMDELQKDNIMIQRFQATCPRAGLQESITRLWTFVWPIVIVLLGVAFRIITIGGGAK